MSEGDIFDNHWMDFEEPWEDEVIIVEDDLGSGPIEDDLYPFHDEDLVNSNEDDSMIRGEEREPETRKDPRKPVKEKEELVEDIEDSIQKSIEKITKGGNKDENKEKAKDKSKDVNKGGNKEPDKGNKSAKPYPDEPLEEDGEIIEQDSIFSGDNANEPENPPDQHAAGHKDRHKKDPIGKTQSSTTTTVGPSGQAPPPAASQPTTTTQSSVLTGNLPIAPTPTETSTDDFWPPVGQLPGQNNYANDLGGLGQIGVFTNAGLYDAQRINSFTIFVVFILILFFSRT